MTESIFNISINNYKCPKCGAIPGDLCKTPKGRKKMTPHKERVSQLSVEDIEKCRIVISKINSFTGG